MVSACCSSRTSSGMRLRHADFSLDMVSPNSADHGDYEFLTRRAEAIILPLKPNVMAGSPVERGLTSQHFTRKNQKLYKITQTDAEITLVKPTEAEAAKDFREVPNYKSHLPPRFWANRRAQGC